MLGSIHNVKTVYLLQTLSKEVKHCSILLFYLNIIFSMLKVLSSRGQEEKGKYTARNPKSARVSSRVLISSSVPVNNSFLETESFK